MLLWLFSQWHMSTYTMNGVDYVCCEQGMMHGKALLFGDFDTARLILKTNSPRKMKSLGRKVKRFSEEEWNKNRIDIVYRNNVAQFTQNENMRKALLETNGALVEASPLDRIWGIGLCEADARETTPSEWKGLNLLGHVLTRVRDEIQAGVHDELIEEGSDQTVENRDP
mmetsp:Transcript_12181/g.26870  ORF Transcript_12181/g.26870 Transcript_12181/m.26870 type:complete len:169 (-) Transcript_12181:181-687(-)